MSGALQPGKPLSERQLADKLGVSRTPVREALAMLDAEELVVLSPAGQLVVREVTVAEIRETYDVRIMVEGYAARLAADERSEDDLRRLRLINDELRRSFRRRRAEQDVGAQTMLDAAFHKRIASASGNRTLERIAGLLVDTPVRERAFFWFSKKRQLTSVEHHTNLLEALESRDPAEAERLWTEHVRLGRDSLVEHLTNAAQAERDQNMWAEIFAESETTTQRREEGDLLERTLVWQDE
jgi:DNA-binding GntR family transcriptional regulator